MKKTNNYAKPLCEAIAEESESVLCQSVTAGATNEPFTDGGEFTF